MLSLVNLDCTFEMRIIFFILLSFLILNSLRAQDTIINVAYKSFFSVYDSPYGNLEPLEIISRFNPKNYTIFAGTQLSNKHISPELGIEYTRRVISINHKNTGGFHSNAGPNGSNYGERTESIYIFEGRYHSLILKTGLKFHFALIKKHLRVGAGIGCGYDFRLWEKIINDQFTYSKTIYSYNGLTGEHNGSFTSDTSKASDINLIINKNSFFTDFTFNIGTNKGKFRVNLSAGLRLYFISRYEYPGEYNTLYTFRKDKFWEITFGYKI